MPFRRILGQVSVLALCAFAATAARADVIGIPGGLGISGPGGLTSDLVGSDPVGGLIGTSGIVGSNIAGGNDGLLGHIGGAGAAPLLPEVGQFLPASQINTTLASVPQLGVSGTDGFSQDLIGADPVGSLIGTEGAVPAIVDGGDAGALGHIIPNGNPPLAAVGGILNGVVGSPGGPVLYPLTGGLGGLPVVGSVLTSVGNAAGNLPVVGSVLSGLTGGGSGSSSGGLGGLPVVGSVLTTVTNTTNNLPVVGGVVSGLTGGLSGSGSGGSGAGGIGGLPVVGGVLTTVTNTTSNLPVVGSVVSGLTGGLTGGSSGGLLGGLLAKK